MKAATTPGADRPRPPASVLQGPAHADNFRVAVGRYGERWYCDPLDSCTIAESTNEVWPSVSTVKKASGADWSFVALKRVADMLEQRPTALDGLDHASRYDILKSANNVGLKQAAQRGTNVHLMAEARLYGTADPIADGDHGSDYRQAVEAFFDERRPELVAAEFVCVHRSLNGYGYAGTCDALVRIDGKTYIVDWKSRGADSNHGAYAEEAAQIAAYAWADYMLVEGPDGPQRATLPDIDGGLIVSIKPDGYRVYPIDLEVAFDHWRALHAWWVARRSERDAIGRQWSTRVSPLTKAQDARAEAFAPAPLKPAPTPAEGVDSDPSTFGALEARYNALSPEGRAWIGAITTQAQQALVPFHAKDTKTQRRFEILTGLVLLAEQSATDDEVRDLLAPIVGDCAHSTANTLGGLVGSMDFREAAQFARLVRGELAVYVSADGTTTLRPAA